MSLAVSIGGLAFLILIHEAGHFLVALAVKMRPRRFYLFFPPALVKRVHRGIEYGIGSIPLGGYVKIPGMHRPAAADLDAHLSRALEEAPWLAREAEPVKRALAEGRLEDAREDLAPLRAAVERAQLSEVAERGAERGLTDVADALSPDAYWRAPAWKRIAVISAGPGTNLLFAVALLAAVLMLGIPVGTRGVDSVNPRTPAASMGLRAGDVIVAVGDRPARTFADVSDGIQASAGRPLSVTVLRGAERVRLEPARPRYIADERRYIIGYRPVVGERTYSFGPAVAEALEETGHVTVALGEALGRIFTGSGRRDVSSVVGITQASSQAVEEGARVYLRILAFISLSLALLNLLPLLPLDGGHIAFSVIEKLRGRAVARETYEKVSMAGIALVLFLFALGLSNDIDRLNGG